MNITRTILHKRGYRPCRNSDTTYFKTRRVKARPENKCTVQVTLRGHGWFDVIAREGAEINDSQMLRGVRQLNEWEKFAFCQ